MEEEFTPLHLEPKEEPKEEAKRPKPSAKAPAKSQASADAPEQPASIWRIAESGVGHIELEQSGDDFLLTVGLKSGLQWQVVCTQAFNAAVDARAEVLFAEAGHPMPATALPSPAETEAANAQFKELGDAFELACTENARLTAENEQLKEQFKNQPHIIDHAGEMTERAYKAEEALEAATATVERQKAAIEQLKAQLAKSITPEELGDVETLRQSFEAQKAKMTEMESNLVFFTELFTKAEQLGLVPQLLA